MKYAVVLEGKFIEEREYEGELPPHKIVDGVPALRPYVTEIPDFNPDIERAVFSENIITDEKVIRKYTIEPLSQKELDAKAHDAALSQGFDTGLGFSISVSESAFKTVAAFSYWVEGVYEKGEEAIYFPDGLFLEDQDSVYHPITFDQLKALKNPYGAACFLAYRKQPKA